MTLDDALTVGAAFAKHFIYELAILENGHKMWFSSGKSKYSDFQKTIELRFLPTVMNIIESDTIIFLFNAHEIPVAILLDQVSRHCKLSKELQQKTDSIALRIALGVLSNYRVTSDHCSRNDTAQCSSPLLNCIKENYLTFPKNDLIITGIPAEYLLFLSLIFRHQRDPHSLLIGALILQQSGLAIPIAPESFSLRLELFTACHFKSANDYCKPFLREQFITRSPIEKIEPLYETPKWSAAADSLCGWLTGEDYTISKLYRYMNSLRIIMYIEALYIKIDLCKASMVLSDVGFTKGNEETEFGEILKRNIDGTHEHTVISLSGGVDSVVHAFALKRVMNSEEVIPLVCMSFPDAKEEQLLIIEVARQLQWPLWICRICSKRPHGSISPLYDRQSLSLLDMMSRELWEEITKELRFAAYIRAGLGLVRTSDPRMSEILELWAGENLKETKETVQVIVAHHADDIDENRLAQLTKGLLLDLDGMQQYTEQFGVLVTRPLLSSMCRKYIIYAMALLYKRPFVRDSTPNWSFRGVTRVALSRKPEAVTRLEELSTYCKICKWVIVYISKEFQSYLTRESEYTCESIRSGDPFYCHSGLHIGFMDLLVTKKITDTAKELLIKKIQVLHDTILDAGYGECPFTSERVSGKKSNEIDIIVKHRLYDPSSTMALDSILNEYGETYFSIWNNARKKLISKAEQLDALLRDTINEVSRDTNRSELEKICFKYSFTDEDWFFADIAGALYSNCNIWMDISRRKFAHIYSVLRTTGQNSVGIEISGSRKLVYSKEMKTLFFPDQTVKDELEAVLKRRGVKLLKITDVKPERSNMKHNLSDQLTGTRKD